MRVDLASKTEGPLEPSKAAGSTDRDVELFHMFSAYLAENLTLIR